jgi:DNA-binding response OmpR family regulator
VALDPKAWINLEKAAVMLIEPNSTNMQILKQIFAGFGVRKPICCATQAEALEVAQTEEINLIVVSDALGDGDGYAFVRQLRRFDTDHNAFTPVIVVSGHTKRRLVGAARDCGANFVVAKPLSPQTMLERIVWVAKECRPFVDTGAYLGPDRRFKEDESEAAQSRRRSDPPKPAAQDDDTTSGGDADSAAFKDAAA